VVVDVLKEQVLLVGVGCEQGLSHVGVVDKFESVVDDFELVADAIASGVDFQLVAKHAVVLHGLDEHPALALHVLADNGEWLLLSRTVLAQVLEHLLGLELLVAHLNNQTPT
jgi:hypothetical protein